MSDDKISFSNEPDLEFGRVGGSSLKIEGNMIVDPDRVVTSQLAAMTAAVIISDSGDVTFDWERIKDLAASYGTDKIDPLPAWCVALLAARSAALEEAAKVAEIWAEREPMSDDIYNYGGTASDEIAAAIRALKTT